MPIYIIRQAPPGATLSDATSNPPSIPGFALVINFPGTFMDLALKLSEKPKPKKRK